jgi:hypothetical protein
MSVGAAAAVSCAPPTNTSRNPVYQSARHLPPPSGRDHLAAHAIAYQAKH